MWNAATIGDLSTRGPDVVTPGTKMPVQRVDDAEDLAAMQRFLERATRWRERQGMTGGSAPKPPPGVTPISNQD